MTQQRKTHRGIKIGTVTSAKRDKTRAVVVAYQTIHPKYGKFIRRKSTYHVHDPNNESHQGDRVEIASCRPISKTKTYRLVRVLKLANIEEHQTKAPS
jgi:small subunit ribosomal protein S17